MGPAASKFAAELARTSGTGRPSFRFYRGERALEFKERQHQGVGATTDADAAKLVAGIRVPHPEATLNCRACQHVVTHPRERIEVNGRHQHACRNPHGFDYRIGCFSDAPGIAGQGETTVKWTWFPGYQWQIGVCAACAVHLGWRFSGPGFFYGLILDRLIERDSKPLH